MKVAIAGATGFVGSRLVEKLQAAGHQVVVLSRDAAKAGRVFPASAYPNLDVVAYTPAESGDWQNSIAGCDAVVNLAGVPIAEERWTEARQQAILDSRRLTTAKLVEAIVNANPKPSVFVSASAIGYYGTSETAEFDESSPAGNDFLAAVCKDWEAAAQPAKNAGTRLAILRLGIVLGMGGALAKMLPPFKLFAGGPIGTGKQWFSWIHREDVVDLILYSLQNSQVQGVLNATAPNPVRMNELCQTLGEVLSRPSWLPVPGFALEMLLGDGAKVVLEGQKVLPKQTLASGFQYQYPMLKLALEEILAGN
ncbi:MAG: TIGR01777 family oxidoreductase [Microcoleus sp. PH2017_25_DOB_D_A]|uniref:thylakoid membrane protein ThyD n=1 Tax=unclassified Microcoleus TaxID=2642155 RepID=UPI001DE0FAA9|nr:MULTISPECIES: TIGR01777 family oxidoreductase [unclassified Microcoleus]TAE40382.1 MAG: TIGR01777 family protein [Oscillatoriales cyanobacterium]MCC3536704.1 TIGR01777 family oxidoreductase [Microcoleus sp. PH2017_25_DOB_D_A]MCC3548843.1 TIGR01777 family oxidoreductase [Microcoleus sp. PH2017_24_DOB_U_A]MCC3571220.1 TIGR01777 family oxidoreductase [Microcoleus sp. PH2017_34_RAT_O_A]MCC3590147.1 TIGR01777 family oxidoreductase [Microcoleus sp. PH2017_28_MFU_U_A]